MNYKKDDRVNKIYTVLVDMEPGQKIIFLKKDNSKIVHCGSVGRNGVYAIARMHRLYIDDFIKN